MLVCAHAATSGAEIFSSFCTIHDTLHDIQHVIVVVGAYAMSQACDVTRVQSATDWTAFGTYFTHVQTCDVTRVQSARGWTPSADISHMFKPVM